MMLSDEDAKNIRVARRTHRLERTTDAPSALLVQEIMYGSRNIFGAFEQLVSPILLQLLANRAESRTLAQVRDLLLPKLMSGEIRLREAEKLVEQVS